LTTFETELTTRFAGLADRTDDASWMEVVARAKAAKRHRRRVPIAIAAALACAVVIVSPATGVGGKVIRLFDSAEPPPHRIVVSLETWNGPQLREGVQARRAIKVLDAYLTPHTTSTLWVAPTKDGGFCTNNGSCYESGFHYDRLGLEVCLCGGVAQDGEILAGPVMLSGETTNKLADSLLLRFENGESRSIPLVWVGEPINTAFFLYGVPKRHWQKGRLPTTLTMLDAHGFELDKRDVDGITVRGQFRPRDPG
jgi:hypothetical protein